jgi:hypothetical protein
MPATLGGMAQQGLASGRLMMDAHNGGVVWRSGDVDGWNDKDHADIYP